MRPEAFLTNRLTADVHGLAVSDGTTTTLPPIDGVVRTDDIGRVVGSWRVREDLRIEEIDPDGQPDWRFIGKQMRGPLGHFHFNNVRLIDDRIVLTSRNLGCYVSMRPGERRAELLTIAHMTPVMMHDGVPYRGLRFATSVDGKVLVHGAPEPASLDSYSRYISSDDALHRGVHSMSESVIRLDEVLGRVPNWCRGLEVTGEAIITTVDGRYGSEERFGLLQMDGTGEFIREDDVKWDDVGNLDGLRYVTGFDVVRAPSALGALPDRT